MSSDDPHNVHGKHLHSQRVTVWCATATFGTIGPYFFENENGGAVTVNAEHTFASATEKTMPTHGECFFFQQDGTTPPHTARAYMQVVRGMFLESVIFRFGDILCPLRLLE